MGTSHSTITYLRLVNGNWCIVFFYGIRGDVCGTLLWQWGTTLTLRAFGRGYNGLVVGGLFNGINCVVNYYVGGTFYGKWGIIVGDILSYYNGYHGYSSIRTIFGNGCYVVLFPLFFYNVFAHALCNAFIDLYA